jgi:hypothetical protein
MRLATGEAPREADGAALPSADGEHEASSSSMTRTEEQRTGNGGGGASHMLLTHSPPLPSKETNEKKSRLLGLAQEIAPGTCGFAAIGHSGMATLRCHFIRCAHGDMVGAGGRGVGPGRVAGRAAICAGGYT